MSLINQMLNDLEKRAPSGPAAETGLLAAAAPADGRRRHGGSLRWGLLLMLITGAGIAGWTWMSGWPSARPVALRATPPEAVAAVPPAPVRAAVPSPVPQNEQSDAAVPPPPPESVDSGPPGDPSPVAAPSVPTEMESLVLVQVGEQLRVAAAFAGVPQHRLMYRNRGSELILELPAGTKTASLPDCGSMPLLDKLAYETTSGPLRLVFSLDRPCRYDELRLTEHSLDSHWTLNFVLRPEPAESRPVAAAEARSPAVPAAAAATVDDRPAAASAPSSAARPTALPAPPPAGALVRRPVTPTPHQRAGSLCRDGITAFRKGRLEKAETALRAALAIEPDHVGARDALLQLLDRQNRQLDVAAALADGVRDAPGHLPYRIRWVRLLIDAGDLSRAREELARTPLPAVAEAPDLLAMLATVNLRQGRYREAATNYRTLLAARPEQSVWWMGLGIALEGDAAWDQARQAYSRALAQDGLSDGLRRFIRKRLAASGGASTGPSAAGVPSVEERS